MTVARAVLCAVACTSSVAAQTVGVKPPDSVYRAYQHEQAIRSQAWAVADRDSATLAAYARFRGVLGPEGRAWWDSAQANPHGPGGVRFGDSTTQAAFEGYTYARRVAWTRAVDSADWTAGPKTWWVNFAVVETTSIPPAGRLYRRPDTFWHDVIVLRRDQLTPERVLAALRFTRATWEAQGLCPSVPARIDITPTDTTTGAGVGRETAEWMVETLTSSRVTKIHIDSLGILPARDLRVAIPPNARLKAPT